MCGVIGVTHRAGVGLGHLDELANPVIIIARDFRACRLALQPAAWPVAQAGDQTIRGGDAERAAVAVIGVEGGEVAERVADLP